ncbi:glycosyltransferase family 9 protein [Endomicrobium proavitum]|uniref:Lipopolysaccharide heptosyltransferase n=1 Tax=Endomicrobium proavitum TaxID=1408281 RepID=A0A0G3WG22_9BACT|nr:glycosyltransferase family 9 protein [Endomicrobium proavitum]AKL97571.1 lipopolysaccharide heptosyltransferase [Endomicrobium proavitum]
MGKVKETTRKFRRSFGKFLFDKRNKSLKTLDMNNVKSILFVRYDDKIGDMVTATSLFREIKKKYPNVKIKVFCGVKSAEVIKNNPNVDKIYLIYKRFWDMFTYLEIRNKIDIAFDFDSVAPKFSHLLRWRIIKPKLIIGLNKEDYNIYDLSINLSDDEIYNKHITYRYKIFLYAFGIQALNFDYDIFIPQETDNKYRAIVAEFNDKKKIVINPSADNIGKCLSKNQIEGLINGILKSQDAHIFLLCFGKIYEDIKYLQSNKVNIVKVSSILESASIIKHSDMVITPDTSIVHVASAFKKKTIALYCQWAANQIIWAPNNPNAIVLTPELNNGDIANIVPSIKVEKILDVLKNFI